MTAAGKQDRDLPVTLPFVLSASYRGAWARFCAARDERFPEMPVEESLGLLTGIEN
jgi:hypothetical protein